MRWLLIILLFCKHGRYKETILFNGGLSKDASIRNLLRGVILTKFQLFDHVLIDLNPTQVCVCVFVGGGGGGMYLLSRSNSNTANVYVGDC